MAAYKEWADKYDTDLIDEMGYVAPVIAGKLLLKYVNDPVKFWMPDAVPGWWGHFCLKTGVQILQAWIIRRKCFRKQRVKMFIRL